MASTIQVRVDADLNPRSTANPYKALTEQQILARLEKAREHAAQGMYKDAAEVSRGMREKYGV